MSHEAIKFVVWCSSNREMDLYIVCLIYTRRVGTIGCFRVSDVNQTIPITLYKRLLNSAQDQPVLLSSSQHEVKKYPFSFVKQYSRRKNTNY